MGTEMPVPPPTTETTSPGSPSPSASFNGWLEEQDVERPMPLTRAEVGSTYTFALDLAPFRYDLPGVASFTPGPELTKTIDAALAQHTKLRTYARPVLLGDTIGYPGAELRAEVWRDERWQEVASDQMIPFDLDLKRLRQPPNVEVRNDEEFASTSAQVRIAGLRFSIEALKAGCAGVAVSIWNQSRTLPLDNVVIPLSIGGADCPQGERQAATGLTTLLFENPTTRYDGALHIFDYSLSGGRPSQSVAIYVPRQGTEECTHFTWQTPVAVGPLFSQDRMKRAFQDVRDTKQYATFAQRIKDNLFPNDDEPCGANAALALMAAQAARSRPNLFVRLVDLENEAVFVPLGPMFLLRDAGGERFFRQEPVLSFPLPRETYGASGGCIRDVTLAVPPVLSDLPTFPPPASLKNRPSEKELGEFMAESPGEPSSPHLFVLLGHQGDGVVYFTDPNHPWDVSTARRQFGRGSVALLSVCSAGDLSGRELRLVRSLNERGFDAIVMSPFEMPDTVGVSLTKHFTERVAAARRDGSPTTIGELFAGARADTVADLSNSLDGEAAEGLLSEVFLAGDASLRLCGKDDNDAR